ncbi:MAG TPA: permease-like cell division protein FtsX [Burkholderiales bacterium]|nr:permease-like cell division protein FtsX [Burkholderiales bacterium]
MSAWLRHHARSLAATLRRLARSPGATALDVLAIGVALALPLGAWVVLANAERFAGHAAGDPQLAVFMTPDAARADAARVEAAVANASGVRRSRFVPKDRALAELKQAEGASEIAATLGSNPLPDAVIVDLAPGTTADAERLAGALRQLPKVALVQLDTLWLQRLDALLRLGGAAVVLLAGLLAVGMIAVTFNTVRLQIVTQQAEIEVSRLIGATTSYVRRPFVWQGTVIGLAGGIVALGLVGGSVHVLNGEVARLAATYGSEFRLVLPPAGDLAACLGFAAALGWAGAYLSVSKHLHEIQPR